MPGCAWPMSSESICWIPLFLYFLRLDKPRLGVLERNIESDLRV